MKIKDLTSNKEFMNKFVTLANESFECYGSYEDVYETYEEEMSDEDILYLLDYCEVNNLLKYQDYKNQ